MTRDSGHSTTAGEPADAGTERLLGRFAAAVPPYVSALWAHGSLAQGDYQEGRSDLDLVAVLAPGAALDEERRRELVRLHEALRDEEPLAAGLHCSYMAAGRVADASLDHFTWAHNEPFERPVAAVARRELLDAGRVLRGPAPGDVLPPLREGELAEFVRDELRSYWYAHAGRPELWHEDIWVTLGMLTVARARVLLREDRLVTKREALGELVRMGAPAGVVADVRALRYDPDPVPAREPWRTRRGELARLFVRDAIDGMLGPVPRSR